MDVKVWECIIGGIVAKTGLKVIYSLQLETAAGDPAPSKDLVLEAFTNGCEVRLLEGQEERATFADLKEITDLGVFASEFEPMKYPGLAVNQTQGETTDAVTESLAAPEHVGDNNGDDVPAHVTTLDTREDGANSEVAPV